MINCYSKKQHRLKHLSFTLLKKTAILPNIKNSAEDKIRVDLKVLSDKYDMQNKLKRDKE